MRALVLALALLPAATAAQTPASDARPAGVKLTKGKGGALLADARGRTLYALNMRIANSRSGASLTYCVGPCQQVWTPLAAPADVAAIGDWAMLAGAQGPQWAYRGNLVFTFKADTASGAIGGDGYDDLWTAIRYVPPPPRPVAPAVVAPAYVAGRYVATDPAGRVLFTRARPCAETCAEWTPLAAGMAARSVGAWQVLRDGVTPHWAYRGKPVFVGDEEGEVPRGGAVIAL